MKTPGCPLSLSHRMFLLALLILPSFCFTQLAAGAEPKITGVRMDTQQIIVTVQVPPGVTKVTLESRSRLGAGAWVPRAVSRPDGKGGELSFRLPNSAAAEILRVRTDTTDALPLSFYKGTNSFSAGATASDPSTNLSPVVDAAPGAGSNADAGAGGSNRTVVESDIWQVSGNTLYFFNQYRGLQVIDLSTPDSPVVIGTYPLPAAGEQMYVVDDSHVVLLAQDNCSTVSGGQSEALVLDVKGGTPSLVASLPVPGWIQESRMVGTALYIASQAYRPTPGSSDGSWQWGSTISSFDLSTPAKPAVKDTLWYDGYGNVIYATDDYLFVSTQPPSLSGQSVLHCIDISSPDGAMQDMASLPVTGIVPDKFKINQSGDVLTVISENWTGTSRGVVTILQTFSLADPKQPAKLGRLELASGEQLHATRFDGNRVYVVTFFQKDPLWVVDLSDPSNPQIVGKLEVPGWSTYIEPLGNRLVSIGVNDTNDWRVAVSLFDVHDPAHPALLSKVPLGVNYSWSEASYDEKAFGVFPDAGLILVPYQGYETNGYASRVQLIDLGDTSLTARGTIDQGFQPRRASVHGDRVYSISGKQLLAVDAADRDHPQVRSTVELSWSVDRILTSGDYLLEVANGNSWGGWWTADSATPPSVRVVSQKDPDHELGRFVFTNGVPIVGASLQGGKLYVAQGGSVGGGPIVFFDASNASGSSDSLSQTNPPALILSVLDASQLPALTALGQTEVQSDPLGWGATLSPLWLRPDLLVWSGGGNRFMPMMGVVNGGVAGGGGIAIWSGGSGSGRLFAFDVTTPASPALASELNLTTNGWWGYSAAFTTGNLVYLGHEGSEFVPGVLLPGQTTPPPVITVDKETGQTVTNQPPVGVWVQRYYLDVVDYTDAKSPTRRATVNIPGQLQGVGHDGALLYTVAPHWTNWQTDWSEWLDASAYDGVSASLVDSLPLPKDWPHPLVVAGDAIFLSRPDSKAVTSQLETWELSSAGKFTLEGTLPLGQTANNLVKVGPLLAVQFSNSALLLDPTNPASPNPVGKGQGPGCLWFDLSQAATAANSLWLPLGDYGLGQAELNAP